MTYFNKPSDLAPVTKARSVDINNLAALTADAFAKLPDELALKTGSVNYVANTGTTGAAYKVQLADKIRAYADGLEVKMRPMRSNTGACTLDVNGIGAVAIKRADGSDPRPGDMLANSVVPLVYQADLNVFRLPPVVNSQVALTAENAAAALVSAEDAAQSASIALKTLAVEAGAPPANPIDGQEWIDAATARRYTYNANSQCWAETGSALVVENATLVDELRTDLEAENGAGLIAFGKRTVFDKLNDTISVKDAPFNAKGDGVTDDTAAFNALWQYVKASFTDVSSEDYVARYILIPPGVYHIAGSINWTGLKARNTHVIGWGAVLVGTGAGKNVVDLIGTRWVQLHGLTVFGAEASMPKCGILLGPEGTVTNGNNYLNGINVTGHFTHAPLWNIGSETTAYVRSRFSNSNTDPAALSYIADGRMRKGATSDYQALRAAGVAVSFTNNQFYSCDIRNMGGGSSVYLEYTRGWGFDRGCYFISFNAANFVIYTAASSTHQSLSIEGLMESAHVDTPTVGNTGCKYNVEFVGDGTNCLIEGFVFKVGVPHSAVAVLKTTNTGSLNIKGVDIVVGRNYVPGTPVFSAPNLTMSGRIHATLGGELNLKDITQFNGSFTVDEGTPQLPPAGAYTLHNSGANRLVFGGSGPYTQDGVWRAEGVAADVDWKGRAKGDGDVELGNGTKTDALRIDIPPAALHGFGAYVAASGAVPYFGVRSATAAVNIGLRSKGAGSSVQIGNDVDGNSWLKVLSQSTFPRLAPDGTATDIDLQLEGKGTGKVRFGTVVATADAAIVNYIEIKDAGGTVRKLAVIA